MITIKEVRSRKEKKLFLDFPQKLYKGNAYYVPPLYMDEKKLLGKGHEYCDQADAVYYLAFRDGKCVGRISGILQYVANEKWKQKRVRFTRFDCIDDQEVANALFDTVEKWGKERGMEEIVGPLNFTDMDREGLLIDGFDQVSTFETQYSYPYYKTLIENYGFRKDVDWIEHQLRAPKPETFEHMQKVSAAALERYGLHRGKAKNTREFLKKYADQFFEMVDVTYSHLYGSVPFTEKMKKVMIANFKLIINIKYVAVIVDKNDKVVCFGLCFPFIGKPLQKSGGHLYPITLLKLLHILKHPKSLDLALIGVAPEYRLKGVSSALFTELAKLLNQDGVEFAETNCTLETNHNILNQWKVFESKEHKRRRCFVKTIGVKPDTPPED